MYTSLVITIKNAHKTIIIQKCLTINIMFNYKELELQKQVKKVHFENVVQELSKRGIEMFANCKETKTLYIVLCSFFITNI